MPRLSALMVVPGQLFGASFRPGFGFLERLAVPRRFIAPGGGAVVAAWCGILMLALMPSVSVAQVPLQLPDAVDCPECSIDVRTLLTIGDVDGPGALVGMPGSVTEDSRGRLWVLHGASHIDVFDRSGRFIRTVSRQGEGPGEYQFVRGLHPVGDSVVLIDQQRMLVFGPEFEHVRSIRYPAQPSAMMSPRLLNIAVQEWPNRVVVNAVFTGLPDAAGWPLHIIDASESTARIVRSFGTNDGTLRPVSREETQDRIGRRLPPLLHPWSLLQRHLWVRPDGGILAAHRYEYVLDSWSPGGDHHLRVARAPEWFPRRDDPREWRATTPSRPADPLLIGLHPAEGHVWVLSLVPAENWQDAWTEEMLENRASAAETPVGGVPATVRLRPSSWEVRDTMVEILDLERRIVVARGLIGAYVVAVLDGGRLVTYSESEIGVPTLQIVLASVSGGP